MDKFVVKCCFSSGLFTLMMSHEAIEPYKDVLPKKMRTIF